MDLISFLIFLAMYFAIAIISWATAKRFDYEGDWLWISLWWTCLGWVIPALAFLRWVT